MRRLSAILTMLMLVLAPACAEASAQERIALAATKTSDAESARMSMKMDMTGGSQDLSITADGVLSFTSQQMSMTMDLGQMGAQIGMDSMDMIVDGQTIYMKFPNAEQLQLPTPWVKMDLEALTGVPGMENLSQMNNNDPSKTMEMLRGVSDDVEEVGAEDVRGTPTTHYKATVDLNQALEDVPEESRDAIEQAFDALGTKTMPVEVWLDEDGLLRRQRLTMDLSKAAGAAGGGSGAPTEMTVDFELYDFGAEVDVKPPPPGQVTDFAKLQGAGG